MREWIVPDNDIGVDGAYFGYQEILRCKDCAYFEKKYGWCKRYISLHLDASEEGFCAWAERKEE